MIHILLYCAQYLWCGSKYADMSSIPSFSISATISSLQFLPYGAARSVLNSLATSSTSLRGRLPMAPMTR